jgi:hypothetical protein
MRFAVLLEIFYTEWWVQILICILIAKILSDIISIIYLRKFKKPLKSLVIPLTAIVYFTLIFSPLPPAAENKFKEDLVFLKENKVKTNGMINRIINICDDDSQGNSIKGFQYEEIQNAYNRDLERHFEKDGVYVSPAKDAKLDPIYKDSKDLCDAAWMLNKYKADHQIFPE